MSALLIGPGSTALAQDQQRADPSEALATTHSAVAAASALGLTPEVAPAETVQTANDLTSVSTTPYGSEITVRVPSDPAQPVTARDEGGRSVGIGIPWSAGTAAARVVEDTAVFTDQQAGFTTTVEPLASGAVRTSVTIAGPDSPKQYRFPMSLDSGSSLALLDDGSVAVSHEIRYVGNTTTRSAVTSTIAPAWAVDANGIAVPTHFTLEGNTLVQHVDLTAATAFPVVADPFWSTAWNVAKCVSAIVVAVASLAIPVVKLVKLKAFVRAVGGVRNAASLLVGATSRVEKVKVIGGAVGVGAVEILGIDQIINNC